MNIIDIDNVMTFIDKLDEKRNRDIIDYAEMISSPFDENDSVSNYHKRNCGMLTQEQIDTLAGKNKANYIRASERVISK